MSDYLIMRLVTVTIKTDGLSGETVFLQFVAKGLSVDTKDLCGAGFVPGHAGYHILDMLRLHLNQWPVQRLVV